MLPFLFVAALLQSVFLPGFLFPGVRPDFVLVVVVGWAWIRGWEEGLIVGLIGGLFVDLSSAAPLGVHTVRLAGMGVLAGFVMARLARTSPALPIAAAAVGSLFSFSFSVLSLQAAGWQVGWGYGLVFQALGSAILSGLVMALAHPLLRVLSALSFSGDDATGSLSR